MKKRILITPLNWGLGHATRCIPIIETLISMGAEVFIAADGESANLLKTHFPQLEHIELKGYVITYPKRTSHWAFFLHSIKSMRRFIRSFKTTRARIDTIVNELNIDAIISDNRFGCISMSKPSVIITHQINLKSSYFGWFAKRINKSYLTGFDEIWVPDFDGDHNLSGDLSKGNVGIKRFIGPISHLKKQDVARKNLSIVLSGPEPQRSIFEDALFKELESHNTLITSLFDKVVLVRGTSMNRKDQWQKLSEVKIIDFANRSEIENIYNRSKLVIARSGYSTLLDLSATETPAILVPTPAQTEQIYLAKRHRNHFFILDQSLSQFDKALNNIKNKPNLSEPHSNEQLKTVLHDLLARI